MRVQRTVSGPRPRHLVAVVQAGSDGGGVGALSGEGAPAAAHLLWREERAAYSSTFASTHGRGCALRRVVQHGQHLERRGMHTPPLSS
jgi:hypothetical protein